MAVLVTANLGRHVGVEEFRRNAQKVKNRFRDRAIIGFQEIDEADTPDEHRIIKDMFGKEVAWAGWETHVPIVVPQPYRMIHEKAIPVAAGLDKQSPARQVVEAVIEHPARPRLDPVVVLDLHFPRKHPALTSRRADALEGLTERVDFWQERGRTVLVVSDTNGMGLSKIHKRFRRIGGEGIDWIGLVEHPKGTQVIPQETGSIDLTIDGHNAWWVKFSMQAPPKAR